MLRPFVPLSHWERAGVRGNQCVQLDIHPFTENIEEPATYHTGLIADETREATTANKTALDNPDRSGLRIGVIPVVTTLSPQSKACRWRRQVTYDRDIRQ